MTWPPIIKQDVEDEIQRLRSLPVIVDVTDTVRDIAGSLLAGPHDGITFYYNSTTNTFQAVVAAPGSTVSDAHIRDVAAQMILAGTHSGISFTYDQAAGTLNATSVGGAPVVSGTLLKRATMEGGSLTGADGFDITQSNGGTVGLSTAYNHRGTYGARIYDNATVSNAAYQRGLIDVEPSNLVEGSEFSYSCAFRLDAGFKASNKYTALMRGDNYDVKPTLTDHLGIHMDSAAGGGGIYLAREQVGGAAPVRMGQILAPGDIYEEQYFYIEVFHRLHRTAGEAVNQAWVNGNLVLDNTQANLFADFVAPWSYWRFGIVATSSAQLGLPRGMYIDDAAVGIGGALGIPA